MLVNCLWQMRTNPADAGSFFFVLQYWILSCIVAQVTTPTTANPMAFQFNQPYESENLMSQEIRNDFAQLVEESCDPDRILRSLAGHLPASDLAGFMDDFAMGRV